MTTASAEGRGEHNVQSNLLMTPLPGHILTSVSSCVVEQCQQTTPTGLRRAAFRRAKNVEALGALAELGHPSFRSSRPRWPKGPRTSSILNGSSSRQVGSIASTLIGRLLEINVRQGAEGLYGLCWSVRVITAQSGTSRTDELGHPGEPLAFEDGRKARPRSPRRHRCQCHNERSGSGVPSSFPRRSPRILGRSPW